MNAFLKLIKTNGAILLIGLLIGLVGGFKFANAKQRRIHTNELNAEAAKAAANLGNASGAMPEGHNTDSSQNQVNEVILRARNNPTDYDAQIEAADQYLQIQRPQAALEFLETATKLKPADPRAMSAQSTAYLVMGNFEESTKWARKALAQKPDDIGSKLLLALSLIEGKKNLGEAEKLLSELDKIRPGDKVLADARESLKTAQTGGQAGGASSNKSTLDHGPAAQKPEPGGSQ